MTFFPQFIFRSPINSFNKTIDNNVFSEALYLSTPVMYEEYQKYLTNLVTNEKKINKLKISIYKYQTRANIRCTPYGLFAGFGIGKWESQNNILIDSNLRNTLSRKTRLDMLVLSSLSQELAKQEFIKPYLKFHPNTSIYPIGNSYRYVEHYYKNNHRFHNINRVDFTPYLKHILHESKKGLTRQKLTLLLVNDEITQKEAANFIDELISSQILINQIEPTLTGIEYFEVLINTLKEINLSNHSHNLDKILEILNDVNLLIKKIDISIFNPVESYKFIFDKLKNILPELTETNLFQTDLNKNTIDSTLNIQIQEQLKNTINFLNKITPVIPNVNLEEFKIKFKERYEENEIPLLIALDTETGIGYGANENNCVNNLIEDIQVQKTNHEKNIKWNSLQENLFKILIKSIKNDQKAIEITDDDFKDIDFSTKDLPSSYSVMFKVLNATNNRIMINTIGGSSSINLLGRFGYVSKELEQIISQIAQFEQQQNPNGILAEIIHLPESRTGNVLARPEFRQYEIPYLAKSSVNDDFQIKMEDLVLKINNNKIILFDKRLKKEIIPRLGNAHNYSINSLPVYHFLCDLQTQSFSKIYIGFNWGALANEFSFLPRVEYKNTILTSARWLIKDSDLKSLQNNKKPNSEKYDCFFRLKNKFNLPEKFLIIDNDNELLIDCNNNLAIDTFIDMIKNKSTIILKEYLFEQNQSLIKDTDGNHFTNECIAIVLNKNNNLVHQKTQKKANDTSKQMFSIGSEWLYYKIYSGAKIADYILTNKLKKITETLILEGIIDKWFFIRYTDSSSHLRLRLHICNFEKYNKILDLINSELNPLLDQNIISKIQTDTYTRELQRYGNYNIILIEELFYHDSVFTTNMLSLLNGKSTDVLRWQMAIRSIDGLLDDFKFILEEKHDLINKLSFSFFQEHGGNKELKTSLNIKHRSLRNQIEYVLNHNNDKKENYYPIVKLINKRSKHNKLIINQILKTNKRQQLEELISSLLHMNINRLFISHSRTNEFVLYDLLSRYYKGNLIRKKNI